jgi:hypothetical protein
MMIQKQKRYLTCSDQQKVEGENELARYLRSLSVKVM